MDDSDLVARNRKKELRTGLARWTIPTWSLAIVKKNSGRVSLIVYGDNLAASPSATYRNNSSTLVTALKGAGVDATLIELPSRGMTGNTHWMMMDKNSKEVAALLQEWLVSKGLATN